MQKPIECKDCNNEAVYKTEYGYLCQTCAKNYAFTPGKIKELATGDRLYPQMTGRRR